MDYLERLVDASFREREDGTKVFFPWGALGSAYLIESSERYRRARSEVRGYLASILPAVAGVGGGAFVVALWLFEGRPVAILVAAVPLALLLIGAGVYYAVLVRPLVEDLEQTDERPDVGSRLWFPTAFPELYSAHLWAAGALVLALVLLMVLYDDADPRVVGLSAGVIALTVYLVRLRWSG